MWRILSSYVGALSRQDVDAATSSLDAAGLIGRYQQLKATSAAVSDYAGRRKEGAASEPIKAEAAQDLVSLSQSKDLGSSEVAQVKAVLAKVQKGQSLSAADIKAVTAVIDKLEARVVGQEKAMVADSKASTSDLGRLAGEGVSAAVQSTALEALAARAGAARDPAALAELRKLAAAGADSVATGGKQALGELYAAGKALHEKAEAVAHGQEPALARLGQVHGVLQSYQELGKKLQGSVEELDASIKALDRMLVGPPGPELEELRQKRSALVASKESLTALQADVAMAAAADAADCAKEGNFPGYRASVFRGDRAELLKTAKGNLEGVQEALKTEITRLKATPGAADRVSLLETKLAQVQQTAGALAKDTLTFDGRVAEANRVALQRAQVLGSITLNFGTLAKDGNLDALMTQGLSQIPAQRDAGREGLDKLRKQMVEMVQKGRDAYAKLGPTQDALKVLDLLIQKLNKYDFTRMDQIQSFGDQVKNINEDLGKAFATMEQGGLTRKAEQDELKHLDTQVADSFDNVDLLKKKQEAIRFDDLERAARDVEITGAEVAGQADYQLENPSAPTDPILAQRDKLVATLQSARRGMPADDPGAQALDTLIERTKKLKAGDPVDLTDLDDKLTKQVGQVKAPAEQAALQHLVKGARAVGAAMAYQDRALKVVATETDARSQAAELAKGDPAHAYGVVHLGWKDDKPMGFRLVRYPAEEYFAKEKQARETDGNLSYMAFSKDGRVLDGGKATTAALGGDFQTGTVDKTADGKETRENAALDQIGSKAKTLALKHYHEATETYQKLTGSDDALLKALLTMHGKGEAEFRKYAEDMFGIDPAVAGGGMKSSLPIYIKLENVLKAAQEKFKRGDEAGGQKLIDDFKKTTYFGAVRAGAKERLALLNSTAMDVATMEPRKAAFVLTRDFPGVRAELYRQLGFRTDPGKGVPPYENKSDVDALVKDGKFASTAEQAFVRRAESWGDWETAKAVAKTAAIITATVALGIATGGAAAPVVAGVALGTSAAVAGYQVYEAREAYVPAGANYSAGLISREGLQAADQALTMAYVSAVVQVGMAGASLNPGGSAVTSTLKGAIAHGLVNTTVATAIDPSTYGGDAQHTVVNFVVGGVVTALGTTAGAKVHASRMPEGGRMEVVFNREQNRVFAIEPHGPGSQPLELRPVATKGDVVTFEIPATGERFEMKVDKTYAGLASAGFEVGNKVKAPDGSEGWKVSGFGKDGAITIARETGPGALEVHNVTAGELLKSNPKTAPPLARELPADHPRVQVLIDEGVAGIGAAEQARKAAGEEVKIVTASGEKTAASLPRTTPLKQGDPPLTPLTPEFIKKNGLEPRYHIPMGDHDVYVSAPFTMGKRTAFLAYIKGPDGKTEIHTMYRSNSAAGFRSASHRVANEAWIGKGSEVHGLDSTNVPAAMNRELNLLAENAPKAKVAAGDVDSAFYGTLDVLPQAYKNQPTTVEGFTRGLEKPVELAKPVPETAKVLDGNGTPHLKPGEFQFPDPKMKPDFSHGPSEHYTFHHPMYGEVDAFHFPSQDGKLEYVICKDKHGHGWVSSVESVDGEVTGFGVKRKPVNAIDLTKPPYEYDTEIPSGYTGARYEKSKYYDESKYVHELLDGAFGKQWREAIDLPPPAPPPPDVEPITRRDGPGRPGTK